MPITVDEDENRCVIRLVGEIDITCSAELKSRLLDAFTSRKELQVSMEGTTELDVTAIQLLFAAVREGERQKSSFSVAGGVPENIRLALFEAGFENFPTPIMPKDRQAGAALPPPECTDPREC